MLEVQVPPSEPLTIWFNHIRPDVNQDRVTEMLLTMGEVLEDGEQLAPYTECSIFRGDEEVPISSGYAQVHPNDNFEKSIGRTLALKRALVGSMGHVTAEERAVIVDTYNDTHVMPFMTVKEATSYRDYLNRYLSAHGKA